MCRRLLIPDKKMHIKEGKAPNRAFPKPPFTPESEGDYMSSLVSGAILLSLIMKAPMWFFFFATVFVSRCLTADEGINWMKALLPLSGMIPAFSRILYDIAICLWRGTPL